MVIFGGKIVSEINGKAGLDPIFAAPSRIALSKGFHSFEIEYFQSVTRNSLFVEIEILEDSEEGLWVTGIPDEVEIIIQGQGFVEDGQEVITNRI